VIVSDCHFKCTHRYWPVRDCALLHGGLWSKHVLDELQGLDRVKRLDLGLKFARLDQLNVKNVIDQT